MTAPAQAALAMTASGTRRWSPAGATSQEASAATIARASRGGNVSGAGLANVRVNNPGEDTHFIDQTTQSEPMIAVAGQNVVVGYNDSQTSIPGLLTAGLDLTGYSYSTDGGQTFTNAGELPNAQGLNNLGDPWLGSDRAGNVYFSNLVIDEESGNLDVGVAKSTNGGKTFSTPTIVSPNDDLAYFGDKDALAVGPDPAHRSHDDVYVAWDDQFLDQDGNGFSGLPVARSTDNGHSWRVSYADKVPFDRSGCSFSQYIGATPAVDPNGVLYVVAERASVDDPNCTGEEPFVLAQWIFKSTDDGQTFGPGQQISTVNEVGFLDLGHGMLMRNLEFPAIAIDPKGTVYVAWNDSALLNHSNIRLATSTDGGATWSLAWATGGTHARPGAACAERQQQRRASSLLPAAPRQNPRPARCQLQERQAAIRDGARSQSFPGVFTVPQFDPIIADAYMGDYIANVSDGTNQYFAWGDNRDTVTNFLWPKGRHDPNVYLAKR